MKISRSTSYALLAAGYLAKHQDQKIVLSDDIAEKYNIPLEYLFKILGQMVKGNVLRSKRGPHGGFSLARPPKKISLLQIIEAVDGPMVSNLYLEEHAKGEKFCKRVEQTYEKATTQARNIFKKMTLADLVE
jgi:Rrf2 family protein